MQMNEVQPTAEKSWFYEEGGKRKGPFPESDIADLIKSSIISHGTSVWTQGFKDWIKVEDTDLKIHLDSSTPPPLSGENINNTVVWVLGFGFWVLAFAPIIGYFLEWIVAGTVHGNEFSAEVAMANGQYFYVTIVLNIFLAFLDERRLKKAGHNTDKFKGWIWLVPVFLYQRAKSTKQNMSYFIAWIVCFFLILFG